MEDIADLLILQGLRQGAKQPRGFESTLAQEFRGQGASEMAAGYGAEGAASSIHEGDDESALIARWRSEGVPDESIQTALRVWRQTR